MALTWEQTKSLIRIQSLTAELLCSDEWRAGGNAPLRTIDRAMLVLVDRIQAILDDADPTAAAEFQEIVTGLGGGWGTAEARARAMLGWVRGAVEAETLEQRLETEARAYAEERVRAERPASFTQP